jgi:hypothetical protein
LLVTFREAPHLSSQLKSDQGETDYREESEIGELVIARIESSNRATKACERIRDGGASGCGGRHMCGYRQKIERFPLPVGCTLT